MNLSNAESFSKPELLREDSPSKEKATEKQKRPAGAGLLALTLRYCATLPNCVGEARICAQRSPRPWRSKARASSSSSPDLGEAPAGTPENVLVRATGSSRRRPGV